jgi:hypothetical protein
MPHDQALALDRESAAGAIVVAGLRDLALGRPEALDQGLAPVKNTEGIDAREVDRADDAAPTGRNEEFPPSASWSTSLTSASMAATGRKSVRPPTSA